MGVCLICLNCYFLFYEFVVIMRDGLKKYFDTDFFNYVDLLTAGLNFWLVIETLIETETRRDRNAWSINETHRQGLDCLHSCLDVDQILLLVAILLRVLAVCATNQSHDIWHAPLLHRVHTLADGFRQRSYDLKCWSRRWIEDLLRLFRGALLRCIDELVHNGAWRFRHWQLLEFGRRRNDLGPLHFLNFHRSNHLP